jgi:hypothetical protein
LDTKLIKSEGLVKSDVPHKTGVPVKSGAPVESPQKAAINGPQSRPSLPTVPLLNTAANLGFPKDALSAAILVFTRFFSFTADKALIGSLRREILDLSKTSSPVDAEEKAALEAKVMAAVIAADKGVFLSPAALERYARFLLFKTSDIKENPSLKTASASQDSPEKSPGNSQRKALEDMPEPDGLKAIAEAQAQDDSLLDYLNYLPGKNGQYWHVFPFNVNVKGIELKVLLRVLQSGGGSVQAMDDGQIIADIYGPKRQWRCFLNKTAGKFRADLRVYPEYPQRALNRVQRQAERFLGNFGRFEEIIVRNGDRIPLWTEDLWPDHLPFVNEEA